MGTWDMRDVKNQGGKENCINGGIGVEVKKRREKWVATGDEMREKPLRERRRASEWKLERGGKITRVVQLPTS